MIPKFSYLSSENADRILRRLLPYYFLLLLLTTAAGSYLSYLTHNGFVMGDWLINYQGGFIRRGLLGETLYRFASITSTDIGLLVVIVHVFFYASFFLFSYLTLIKQRNIIPYLLLIFSPFIFSFQINDILGGYRKEIIFFAILSFTVWSAHSLSNTRFEKFFFFTLCLYPLLILAHEALSILLPYLIIIYLIKIPLDKTRFIKLILLVFFSVVTFLICCYFSGTPPQVEAIRLSLGEIDYQVGSGAIDWLGRSALDNMTEAHNLLRKDSYNFIYAAILLLAAVAYIPIRKNLATLLTHKYVRLLLLIALTGTLPLFIVTHDYGRLIYYHLVSIFIVSLAAGSSASRVIEQSGKSTQSLSPKRPGTSGSLLLTIFFIFYTLTWYIPHYHPGWYYQNVPLTTPQRFTIIFQILDNSLRSR